MKQKAVAASGADDDCITVGHKRRLSAASSPQKSAQASHTESSQGQACGPKTPANPKKKVRFSDPGPNITDSSLSSGVTPYVARATLTSNDQPVPTPRLLAKAPRRRASLPSLATDNFSAIPPSPTLSGVVQFTPIRQVLSARVIRRIRRNGLSEEMNEINAEKRTRAKIEQELQEVKNELSLAKERAAQAVRESTDTAEYLARIQELEEEVGELKEKIDETLVMDMTRIPTHEGPDFTMHRNMAAQNSNEPEPDLPSTVGDEDDETSAVEMVHIPHNEGPDFTMHRNNAAKNSKEPEPDLPSTIAGEDDDYQIRFRAAGTASGSSTSDVGTQTGLSRSDIATWEKHKIEQTTYLIHARMELERLFPGETTTGLEIHSANAKPVLDALLERLRATKELINRAKQELSTTQTLEANLRTQFNVMLGQLQETRTSNEQIAAERQATFRDYHKANRRANDLEVDIMERDNTIKKLGKALEWYRKEIADTEAVVAKLEKDHAAELKEQQEAHDEAIADLECHVAAESYGRREAEAEAEQRLLRVMEMETLELELKNAINEKQALVRSLEQQVDNDQLEHETIVGSLNARIGEMASTIEACKTDISNLETQKANLIKQINHQKKGRLRATEEMKAAMKRAMDSADAISQAHAKDVLTPLGLPLPLPPNRNNGLLTPDSAIKFNTDKIPGAVQMGRGKGRRERRIDSGVYLPELDEGEEEMAYLLSDMPSSDMPGSEL